MVKKYLLFLFIAASFLKADMLDEKIQSFMSETKYKESKNLINYVFSPRENYYNNDDINTLAILETLNNNGLLELFYEEPQDIELIFQINFNHLASLKVISESLNSMGYNFFLTKKISKSSEGLFWDVTISTQYIPNPVLLSTNLVQRGIEVENIIKEGNIWSYKIDSKHVNIESIQVLRGVELQLKKPLIPYWISIEDNAKTITIKSNIADFWYPRVYFYDLSLNLLQATDIDSRRHYIKLKIPEKTKYIKIEDKYTLDNIKRGLKILAE